MSSNQASNRENLKRLIREAGIRPRREHGQHFLIEQAVAEELVKVAHVEAGDTIFEIGPGFGIVTDVLVRTGAQVIAVELDRKLAAYLTTRFRSRPNVEIIQGDVLAVRRDRLVDDGGYKLVSSLPFNITSLVLRTFLEHPPRPTVLSLLIQQEVAERVTAPPGKMSLLSVAVQYLATPHYVRSVPRSSFLPEPEVDAALIRVDVVPLPPASERQGVFRCARMGFSARRKMLRNNLEAGLHKPRGSLEDVLIQLGLNPTVRAQDLSVQQWQKLAKKLL